MKASAAKQNGIMRGYYVVTRADGTVEKPKKVFSVTHSNPLKKLFYTLKERFRD